MTAGTPRRPLSWSARLLIALTLVLVGSAAAVWALARYDRAAVLLGVAPQAAPTPRPQPVAAPLAGRPPAPSAAPPATADAPAARIADLEARLARVEQASERAAGSAGRADALVVAFAARRAIDRGAPLGYLEALLVDRFGRQHPRAVATIITASRNPVRLDELIAEFEAAGPDLRGRGIRDGFWTSVKRELGSLVEIRRADQPAVSPDARYARARDRLANGNVAGALAEAMRLPGAGNAPGWIAKARRYVAAHQALDEIESSALLAGNGSAR